MKQARTWRSAAAKRLIAAAGTGAVESAVEVVCARLVEGVGVAPIDLDAVMARVGVSGWVREELPYAGELKRDGESLQIAVSKHFSPERVRFTIAHEIGHAFFEQTGPNPPRQGEELERICDMIAAELLMPRAVFEAALGSREASLATIKELARRFQASLETTAIRVASVRRNTVFVADPRGVVWGRGIIRRGKLFGYSDEFERTVRAALAGQAGAKQLLGQLGGSDGWTLEWTAPSHAQRALFVLRKTHDADATVEPFVIPPEDLAISWRGE